MGLLQIVKAGVVAGDAIEKIQEYAKKNNFAIPSVQITTIESLNATLEAASKSNASIMLELSYETAKFLGGKIVKGDPFVLGASSVAHYLQRVVSHYKIPVFLNTGTLQNEQLETLIASSEAAYKKNGKPLFTTHRLDLSGINYIDGIKLAQKYLKQLHKIGSTLEIALAQGYAESKEMLYFYVELRKISVNFMITIVPSDHKNKKIVHHQEKIQKNIKKEFKTGSKPFNLTIDQKYTSNEIKECINTGVVKIAIDHELKDIYNDTLTTVFSNKNGSKIIEEKKLLREIQKAYIKKIQSAIKEFNGKNTL